MISSRCFVLRLGRRLRRPSNRASTLAQVFGEAVRADDRPTSGTPRAEHLVASTPSSAGRRSPSRPRPGRAAGQSPATCDTVPHRADDVDVRAQPEQELERLPKDVVVLDQRDTNGGGRHGRTLGNRSAQTKPATPTPPRRAPLAETPERRPSCTERGSRSRRRSPGRRDVGAPTARGRKAARPRASRRTGCERIRPPTRTEPSARPVSTRMSSKPAVSNSARSSSGSASECSFRFASDAPSPRRRSSASESACVAGFLSMAVKNVRCQPSPPGVETRRISRSAAGRSGKNCSPSWQSTTPNSRMVVERQLQRASLVPLDPRSSRRLQRAGDGEHSAVHVLARPHARCHRPAQPRRVQRRRCHTRRRAPGRRASLRLGRRGRHAHGSVTAGTR